jgi:hypothetical protein
MTKEEFDQIVAAIIDGRYSWACFLILRFTGYEPLDYIPYRTYNRLIKENLNLERKKIALEKQYKFSQEPSTNNFQFFSKLEKTPDPGNLLTSKIISSVVNSSVEIENVGKDLSNAIVYQCQCLICQQPEDSPEKKLHAQMNLFLSRLNEQQRRWYVALEAIKLGHGGGKHMSQVTGMHTDTIRRGRKELDDFLAERPVERSRLEGGGRKSSRFNA